MVGAADLAREEATWLRRVRVKTTAVTAKTAAARSGRSTRLERAARKSVGRRTGMRAALESELKQSVELRPDRSGEADG
jgi:glucokinase